MHILIHTGTCACACAVANLDEHVETCAYERFGIYVSMHTCMHGYMCIHAYVHVCAESAIGVLSSGVGELKVR